jgi:aminoglycoside 3-N-acetyltransferase
MRAVRRRAPFLDPEDLIQILQNLLQPGGTLLMPTFPFEGNQAAYVAANERFHVRNTPSKVGALTEVFRNMSGVLRSVHPTHPVAAWGEHARELLATHHEGSTFGVNSPFYKLREYDGLVIGLGTRLRNAFTIIHVAEDINPASRELAFDESPRTMIVEDGVHETPFKLRVMRAGVRRRYEDVEKILVAENILRFIRVRGLQCTVTNASAFIARTLQLAEANNYLLRAVCR